METQDFARIQLITTIVVAAANVVLVLLTSVYVYLTRRMVREMKSSREPSVFVDLEFPEEEARIAILNSGQSPAIDVRFKVEEDIPWRQLGSHPVGLNTLNVIKKGISYLPAGRSLKFMAGFPDWKSIDETNGRMAVHVNYKNEDGNPFEREYIIDVDQYRSILFESFRDPNREVAKAIRDTERDRSSREQSRSMFTRFAEPPRKSCPVCAEYIPKKAKKCPKCHEFLPDEPPDTLEQKMST